LGIIGRNNLLIQPEWGSRIRLRAILLPGECPATQKLKGFAPYHDFRVYHQKVCHPDASPKGAYNRPRCNSQMNADLENPVPKGQQYPNGERPLVISYCRADAMACPAGGW